MIKFWKPVRVTVSLIALLLITAVFIDFKQIIPSTWYNGIVYLQFVPSVRKFFIVASLFSAGFLVVLAITLLVGRVYCAVICPLGILQDVISFVSKKFRNKTFGFSYSTANNYLRYGFLAIAIVPLFAGSITILYLLDPFSNFGRFASDFGKPVYILVNNAVANVLIHLKIYSVAPQAIAKFSVMASIFPAVLLVVVVYLSVIRGRLFCNTACPVGTFLGILSRFSIFKIKINTLSCTKCNKCVVACKSECISIKEQKVDFSRCVGCFNCLKVCDNQSIAYKFDFTLPKKEISKPTLPTDASKRNFIASSILLTGTLTGISKLARAANTNEKSGKPLIPVKKNHVCSPPGSISINHFNNACTACHLCVSACPSGVLQPALTEYGLIGFMQPYLDNHANYCNYECVRCSEVCPTGAILPITKEVKKTIQLGKVIFIRDNCLVYTNETSCGVCAPPCPTQAVFMVQYKGSLTIPEVNVDTCTGCGACEYVCPVRPHRAIYVEGNPIHLNAKPPEVKSKDDKKPSEDFPF